MSDGSEIPSLTDIDLAERIEALIAVLPPEPRGTYDVKTILLAEAARYRGRARSAGVEDR